MENNNYVAPVDHGILSSTGAVAGGAAVGFLKNGLTTLAWCVGIGIVVGALAATGVLPMASLFGGGELAAGFLPLIGKILVGSAVGGLAGTAVGMVGGTITSAVGAVTGAGRALDQVKAEKGAANVVQAQVAAYRAQAQAQAYAAANDNSNKYNFPVHGSAMNPAMASIQADSAQNDGPINGRNLQIA